MEKTVEDHGALGYIVIRGLNADDEEEEEEEDSEDKCDKYTAAQMDAMRVILVTESREKLMKKADKFASGGQAGSGFCMFNTHSGNVTIAGIPKEISKISKLKTIAERFDGLFALTFALSKWDYWLVQQVLCQKFPIFHTRSGCMTMRSGTRAAASTKPSNFSRRPGRRCFKSTLTRHWASIASLPAPPLRFS